jgi:hypothetical protein
MELQQRLKSKSTSNSEIGSTRWSDLYIMESLGPDPQLFSTAKEAHEDR